MASPTGKKSPNFEWSDGSGFKFDLPPSDVVWGGFDDGRVDGEIYTTPYHPDVEENGGYAPWTNWMDHAQPDYRFTALSDANAEANLFPNVHDPWMFTEYVYHGTGREDDSDSAKAIADQIITPQLFAPYMDRTDPDMPTFFQINDKLATKTPLEVAPKHVLEHQWSSNATGVLFWESELDELGWREDKGTLELNVNFTKTPNTRSVVNHVEPVPNSGVKLYHQSVWSQATRFGQSQNIPTRVLNCTAPEEWFKPTGIYTGSIEPKVNIILGVPMFDRVITSHVGDQQVIWYDKDGDIIDGITFETANFPGGEIVHLPETIYAYDTLTGPGSIELDMPETEIYPSWSYQGFENNDLVHRGCAHWQGNGGEVKCNLYHSNSELYQLSSSASLVSDQTSDEVEELPLPLGFNVRKHDIELVYTLNDHTLNITHLVDEIDIDNNVVKLASVLRPLEDTTGGGLVDGYMWVPGDTAEIEIRAYPKSRPVTDPAKCSLYFDGEEDQKAAYEAEGGKCHFYLPTGPRVVAAYTANANSMNELERIKTNYPPRYSDDPEANAAHEGLLDTAINGAGIGGPGGSVIASYGMGLANAVPFPDYYIPPTPNDPMPSFVEISYEPVVDPIEGKERYYNTPDGKPQGKHPEKDIRIKEGTGYYVIDDKKDEPYEGVDPIHFGMINQINYRVTENIMHCYRAEQCDKIITGMPDTPGFRRGVYSNVDFSNHEARIDGYEGYDGTDRYCHYGNMNCPRYNLDRRAVEYDGNYRILLDEILVPFRSGGMASFDGRLREAFLVEGVIKFGLDQVAVDDSNAVCVAVHSSNGAAEKIGHWSTTAADEDGNDWRMVFFYTRPTFHVHHRYSQVFAHIVQFDDSNVWQTNDFDEIEDGDIKGWTSTAYQSSGKIPWLVKLEDDYKSPTGNFVRVTNNKPFVGGRHPEYRDRSKRGREIMTERGGYSDSFGREGATESNQFGGPPFNRAPVRSRVKVGYWVQKDGEFVIDETVIPQTSFASPEDRISNKPSAHNGVIPILGVPSVTTIDPDNPTNNQVDRVAEQAHTYANDTADHIQYLRDNWENIAPKDDYDNPLSSPPNPYPEMLPVERLHYRCELCGVRYNEEEVNYYIEKVDEHGNLQYPTPAGADPASVCGCPRNDGGGILLTGAADRILDCHARGDVHFWGPPGATVRHNAYYWKMPTVINRMHEAQLTRKLGAINSDGGGYSFGSLEPSVNRLGKYPESTNRTWSQGLHRQLILPHAEVGASVQQIRNDFKDSFGIEDNDVALKINVDESHWVVDEPNTTVAEFDAILFYRETLVNKFKPVGVPVRVGGATNDGILDEESVVRDTDRPERASYSDDLEGSKVYKLAEREWLIGSVADSLLEFGSANNPVMVANAIADNLVDRGLDARASLAVDVLTGDDIEHDDRIMAPFTDTEDGGLQVMTVNHMKRLRNRIIPMLAYSLNGDNHPSAGGDYNSSSQKSHELRFGVKKKEMPFSMPGVIEPQVLAATSTGKDYYVEWPTGDEFGSTARAYFPVGSTWWRLNQKVGQIKRSGGTNPLHLDDSQDLHDIPYTGDTITSVVAYFLHGQIPMDKEVVAAYLVYSTTSNVDAAPVGCQGVFTGNLRPVGFPDADPVFVGHQDYCFFQHYHSWTTNHEIDQGSYNQGDSGEGGWGDSGGYWGYQSKIHTEIQVDPPGNRPDERIDDASRPWLMSDDVPILMDLSMGGKTPNYESWVSYDSDTSYYDHVNILGLSFADMSYGFDVSQEYFDDWEYGQNLVQIKTEHEVWKDLTFEDYDVLKNQHSAVVTASVGGGQISQSFNYFSSIYRNGIFPAQHQAIPGWVNLQGNNTSGSFSKHVPIAERKDDLNWASGPQVIVQSEGAPGGLTGISDESGDVPRVLDITSIIKSLYEDRVDRYFACHTGVGFDSLHSHSVSQYHTNLGRNAALDDAGTNYGWNYRYFRPDGKGMWLNDPFHMPVLNNDRVIPTPSNGDSIQKVFEDDMKRMSSVAGQVGHYAIDLTTTASGLSYSSDIQDGGVIIPQDNSGNEYYWIYTTNKAEGTKHFVTDLRQTPIELSRKNWRYRGPSFENGVEVPGDGIATVSYDDDFDENAIVTAIEVNEDVEDYLRHGFTIEYYNADAKTWRPLLQVEWNDSTNMYRYLVHDGIGFEYAETADLPILFEGCEGSGGLPKNPAASSGSHFVAPFASKLRYKVDSPKADVKTYKSYQNTGFTVNNVETEITVPEEFSDLMPEEGYVEFQDGAGDVLGIVNIAKIQVGNNETKVELDAVIGDWPYTQIQFKYKEFAYKCQQFNVYGFTYKPDELTVTSTSRYQPLSILHGNHEFRMYEVPTKILKVSSRTGRRIGIPMEQVDDPNDVEWSVQIGRSQDTSHVEVIAGKYYYDHTRNSILMSTSFVHPTTGVSTSIWDINKDIYDDPSVVFNVVTRPTQLDVEYFTGTGASVDLEIEAVGDGPSYQLEADCVCNIAGQGSGSDVPSGLSSDPLPDMGHSEKLTLNGNQRYNLDWLVYNHEPIHWERDIRWIIGHELMAGAWGEDQVLNLFTGGRGKRVSELGPGAYLRGKAKGRVALYGTPDTIVSGDLLVYAKSETERTYVSQTGGTVTFRERTGGYREGCFTFDLKLDESVSSGRKAIACAVPQVLIYLRERDLEEPL